MTSAAKKTLLLALDAGTGSSAGRVTTNPLLVVSVKPPSSSPGGRQRRLSTNSSSATATATSATSAGKLARALLSITLDASAAKGGVSAARAASLSSVASSSEGRAGGVSVGADALPPDAWFFRRASAAGCITMPLVAV